MSGRILIAGLGNPLMADDGVGHAVIGRLERSPPPGLHPLAIAGDVLGLAESWTGEEEVWLVDAISTDSPAGALHVIEHEELLRLPSSGQSCHNLSLSESLRWLIHGCRELAEVRFRFYGVEVDTVRPEVGLSPRVEAAVDRLAEMILTAAVEFLVAARCCEE